MRSLCLLLARFSVSAWVGAATLFVVSGVREVTSDDVSSHVRDILVGIRFPAYYSFGMTLMILALLGSVAAYGHAAASRRRTWFFATLLAVALTLMMIDYFWIYTPLLQMVTPPGQAKPAGFRNYHDASKWINLAGLALSLVAAVLINWPVTCSKQEPANAVR